MAKTTTRTKVNEGSSRHSPLQFRWKNFRSFKDTEWFELRPVTIILGANNSGKTNLIRPLLLLKQTLDSGDENIALKITGPLADVGTFKSIVHGRDATRTVEFSVRFRPVIKDRSQKPKAIGVESPAEVRLEFGMGRDPLEVILVRFEIFDTFGRSCLVRRRLRNGNYSLATQLPIDRKLRKFAMKAKPGHFLFSGFDILKQAFEEQDRQRKGKPLSSRRTPRFPINSVYVRFTYFTERQIVNKLSSLNYVGPLREYPKRFYESTEEVPESVGVRGELAPHILYLTKNKELQQKTDEWLRIFGLARSIAPEKFHDDLFALNVKDINGASSIDYSDIGFGLSQLLPIIVQGFHSQERELQFFEQPEIHLNPRLQCQLANLFADISDNKKTVILETHSEHLVLRIRTLIAEGRLRPERVALYYVEKELGTSVLRRIPISSDGHIQPEQWPAGFFEESLGEALRLARVPKTKGGKERVG